MFSGFVLASLLGTSLGLLLCCLEVYSEAVARLAGPVMKPLFWMSGLFFTAEGLPSQLRTIFLYNPVLHATELVRDGWFPQYRAYHASWLYVLCWTFPLLLCGLALERSCRRRLNI
jgi:capsular polysaccharide transport system permease protein